MPHYPGILLKLIFMQKIEKASETKKTHRISRLIILEDPTKLKQNNTKTCSPISVYSRVIGQCKDGNGLGNCLVLISDLFIISKRMPH